MADFLYRCVMDQIDGWWTGAKTLGDGASIAAQAFVASCRRSFRTWKFHFYLSDPQHDWFVDDKWPCWFTDALDRLSVRMLPTRGTIRDGGRVPLRFTVSQKFFDCHYGRSVEESERVLVVDEDGVGKSTKTDLTENMCAVYKTNGAYYSHKHSRVGGCITPDMRLSGYVTMKRVRARFLVPMGDYSGNQGVDFTRHYQTNWSRDFVRPNLPRLQPQAYETVKFSDMTLDTIRARSAIRDGIDYIAGLMNDHVAACNNLGVSWLFVTAVPMLEGAGQCEDFSQLPYHLQPRVPIPRQITTAVAAVVTTRSWEIGMRDTLNSRLIQELKKENIFLPAEELLRVQAAVAELMRIAKSTVEQSELDALTATEVRVCTKELDRERTKKGALK
jgi:hypothetical protein